MDPGSSPLLVTAEVHEIPACDFCGEPAKYDGKTHMGPWAYMDGPCFTSYGVGLGMGRGQRLYTLDNK